MRKRTILPALGGVLYVGTCATAHQGVCFSERRVLSDEEIAFRTLERIALQDYRPKPVERENFDAYVAEYEHWDDNVPLLPLGGVTVRLIVRPAFQEGRRHGDVTATALAATDTRCTRTTASAWAT